MLLSCLHSPLNNIKKAITAFQVMVIHSCKNITIEKYFIQPLRYFEVNKHYSKLYMTN